jgi:hypothetical protein
MEGRQGGTTTRRKTGHASEPGLAAPSSQRLAFAVSNGGKVEWSWPAGHINHGTLSGKQTEKSVHALTGKSGSNKYLPKSRYSASRTDLPNAWWLAPLRTEDAGAALVAVIPEGALGQQPDLGASRAQGDKTECDCDALADRRMFKNFAAACISYAFPGSHQVGSYGLKGQGIVRTYSNATPGKDVVLGARVS